MNTNPPTVTVEKHEETEPGYRVTLDRDGARFLRRFGSFADHNEYQALRTAVGVDSAPIGNIRAADIEIVDPAPATYSVTLQGLSPTQAEVLAGLMDLIDWADTPDDVLPAKRLYEALYTAGARGCLADDLAGRGVRVRRGPCHGLLGAALR